MQILFKYKSEADIMDQAGVQAAFVAAGLSRLLKDIDFLAKDSIRLYSKLAGEYDISIGASRIGGVPDVPVPVPTISRVGVPAGPVRVGGIVVLQMHVGAVSLAGFLGGVLVGRDLGHVGVGGWC